MKSNYRFIKLIQKKKKQNKEAGGGTEKAIDWTENWKKMFKELHIQWIT